MTNRIRSPTTTATISTFRPSSSSRVTERVLELLRREADCGVAIAVVSERRDGDVHPIAVGAETLRRRQRALTGREWTMVDQVHGTAVFRTPDAQAEVCWPVAGTADVVVASSTPVAVWAADCAEIMLFDRDGAVVGCHAGWRGLAAGILDVAVNETTSPVAAVLGPCIHPCCYQFGERELQLVADGVQLAPEFIAGTTSHGALALDVPAAVVAALARHGIELDVIGPCTGCDGSWFSHRRGDVERHAVVAWYEAVT
jgi:copper oxidase (laccase) domain-containing protein